MPGWRFKLWPIYRVSKHPWVQVSPGAIGVVIAQVGGPAEQGAKSAVYRDELGDFSDLRKFLVNGGQRGVQRPVMPPGTTLPIHPIAFLVVTRDGVFGKPMSEGTGAIAKTLTRDQLSVTDITPIGRQGIPQSAMDYDDSSGSKKSRRANAMLNQLTSTQDEGTTDVIGVVTILDGPPLPSGDIAGRIGGFEDIVTMESTGQDDSAIIQTILGTKNKDHNNYQNFQAFLDHGGCIGLQHDPLLYGSYLLNPFLVKVEIVPMLVVRQGEAAVIKSYVGLPSEDTSGDDYRFGSIVKPGHRGIWSEPLRTGKYPLNPRIYQADVVPTSILTLNWAEATSEAHDLDANLSSIDAKSKEAFAFRIDLQVQIHVPDTKAPKVIGMVGTMQNLVNEVLQSAVGNYFRNALQRLAATEFIEKRDEVQRDAETYVTEYLRRYDVEVRGVYIQDVVFPTELVQVLTSREIAAQEKTTYASQQAAQQARVALEAQRGEADMQVELARARVSVNINKSNAEAAIAQAEGTADVTRKVGQAEADKIAAIGNANAAAAEALGLANAKAYTAQRDAIGQEQTALVAALHEIGAGGIKITPETLVGGEGGATGGLLTLLLTQITSKNASNGSTSPVHAAAPSGEDAY